MDIKDYAMQTMQDKYFTARKKTLPEASTILKQCKEIEKEVKQMTADILEDNSSQGNLFDS